MTTHPTPWRSRSYSGASGIYDADDRMVETVYERPGDPHGEALAARIVRAVNLMAALEAEDQARCHADLAAPLSDKAHTDGAS